MIELLKLMYAASGVIMVAAYIPNIIEMLKIDESESSILTWFIWYLSSCVAILYGWFVLHDVIFTMISCGHFLGTGVSCAIQVRKKFF